ncbi:MAG: LPS-assembly protein LptD [Aquificaceae bacterium]
MLKRVFLATLFVSYSSLSAEIFSDYLERLPDGYVIAEGYVQAYYEKYYLEADYLRYNPETREVYAEGNVYVKSLDSKMQAWGKSAFLDLKENTGYFIDTHGRFEKFYFTAQRVNKNKDVYFVEDGEISTCPPDRKEMALCFSHAKVTEEHVFSSNNFLRFFKVPIAYLPFASLPVGERRSGLLYPTIGSNVYNNFIYQQPAYLALSQDKDATLTLDIRDKQASGISLEYRQAFSEKKDFMGFVSFYKEPLPPGKWWEGRDPTTFKRNRYKVSFDLNLGNLKGGLDLVSDPYFMQDVYLHTRERTVPYLSSYLTYTKEWDRFLFTVDARRFYDLTSPNNRQTLQKLPEVGIYYKDAQIFKNLYFNTTFVYTNFYRENGPRANRLILFPEFSIPMNFLGRTFYSTLTLENGVYMGSNIPNTDRSFSTARFIERVPFFFDRKFGNLDFKNILEVAYGYRPKSFNNPRFDSFDSIDKESLLSLSFKNYSTYKGRQVLSLYVQGGYSFLENPAFSPSPFFSTPSFTELQVQTVTTKRTVKGRLIPIRSIVTLSPLSLIRFSSDNLYDANSSRLLNTTNYLNLNYKNMSLSLGYVQSKDLSGNKITDQSFFSMGTLYRGVRFTFSFVKDNRIDKNLYKQLNIEKTGACWSLGMLLRNTYDGNRQKYIKEVFLTFNVFDLQKLTLPLKR